MAVFASTVNKSKWLIFMKVTSLAAKVLYYYLCKVIPLEVTVYPELPKTHISTFELQCMSVK